MTIRYSKLRKLFMKTTMLIVFSGFVILLGILFVQCSEKSIEQKPNIVLILADDLGWSQIGCYGSDFYQTPNIDQLAKEGMRFTDAYAAAPVCSPTRASILTGKYPARFAPAHCLAGGLLRNRAPAVRPAR